MDFEKILPFIILGVYLLSLFGKKKKPQKEAPTQETYSLKNIIQGIAKQLKDQVDSVGRSFEQSDQKHQKTVKRDEPEIKPTEIVREKKEGIDIPQLDTLLDEEEEGGAEEVLSQKSEAESVAKKAKKKMKICKTRLPENLQRAVIWHEILAPPIALRDDNERLL